MSTQHRIDLLTPGLFGPVPVRPGDLPATPALVRALGRADRLPAPGSDPKSALLACFGVDAQPDQELPSAPFCHLADLPDSGATGYVMHADPVHLRPDRDQVRLFDSRHLGVTAQESEALVALFNRHFAEDGLRLEAPVPERWYLRAERPPRLRSSPLYAAVGHSIAGLLPTGPDAPAWARLLNEAQMLFHHAETNRIREQEGRPTVSGIWPWGGGCLPDALPPAGYDRVYATDVLARGLAAASGVRREPLPEDSAALLESRGQGAVLVLWDGLWASVLDADGAGWMDALVGMERWLGPLLTGLGKGRDACLNIHPCNGERYRVRGWDLRRFWRRPFALGARAARRSRA